MKLTRRSTFMLGILALLVVPGIGVAAVRAMSPHLYTGTVLQQSKPAPPLSALQYHDGSPVDLAELHGDVVVLFFGYTHCPDVCPTSLSMTAAALRSLDSADRDRVQVLMVTVDPERDLPDELQDYVAFFDPTFRGVTGTDDDIATVAAAYGIFRERGLGTAETGYLVDHTATTIGIDADGSLRIVWPPDITAPQLAADLKELLS